MTGTLSRGSYIAWGMALMALKFGVDFLAARAFHHPWQWLDYFGLQAMTLAMREPDRAFFVTLLCASLPFAWLGVALSVRRLRDARLPVWLVVLFFVPSVKLVFFALLCIVPSRHEIPPVTQSPSAAEPPPLPSGDDAEGLPFLDRCIPRGRVACTLVAIGVTAVMALLAIGIGTLFLREYGWSLFVGVPFCLGLVSVLIHGYHEPLTLMRSVLVSTMTLAAIGLVILLVAIEGAICILMAAPIAWGLSTLGAFVGYEMLKHTRWRRASAGVFCCVLLALPFMFSAEHWEAQPAPVFPVTSAVEINAPPAVVWRHVVSFSELPPPHEWLFKLGIAYPKKAEISGTGVGAVRHCVFSTGAFVEPIQVWDEPRLLKFSVTSNPAPMEEWTPYHDVHPPHLDGFLASHGGQFRLVPLPDGRTRLEGTTWYQHHLWPASYWKLWSDQIIHKIHLRVLNHVKSLAENDDQRRDPL